MALINLYVNKKKENNYSKKKKKKYIYIDSMDSLLRTFFHTETSEGITEKQSFKKTRDQIC